MVSDVIIELNIFIFISVTEILNCVQKIFSVVTIKYLPIIVHPLRLEMIIYLKNFFKSIKRFQIKLLRSKEYWCNDDKNPSLLSTRYRSWRFE